MPKTLSAATLTFCLMLAGRLIAQEPATLSGKILQADGRPAAGASISLIKQDRRVFADNLGYFFIKDLLAINDTMVISSVNAKSFWHKYCKDLEEEFRFV